jgi:hypothetical protein
MARCAGRRDWKRAAQNRHINPAGILLDEVRVSRNQAHREAIHTGLERCFCGHRGGADNCRALPSPDRIFGPNIHGSGLLPGWALNPGTSGWYTNEGRALFTVNGQGLHGPERPKTKPLNTIRIAVLGDSFTEARQVPMSQNFCSVIERELAQCPGVDGKHIEVLNFGVAGYGTTQELITLHRYVWDYSPDVVVLAFYTGNDVLDNSPQMSTWTHMRPFFVKRNRQWELDNSFQNLRHFRKAVARETGLGRWLYDHLRLVQLFEAARQSLKGAAEGGGLGISALMYKDTPALHDAWEVTYYMLSTMHREVEARSARFLLVTLNSPIMLNADSPATKQFARQHRMSDLFYPDKRMASWAAATRVQDLSFAEPFRRYAGSHHGAMLYLSKGHFSIAGHLLAGQLIANRLCEMRGRNPRQRDE